MTKHAVDVRGLAKRKRAGAQHSRDEIDALVTGYSGGHVDDETFTLWLRAVMAAGMTIEETAWLTDAMAHSGTTINWAGAIGTIVDKHSTGGVGDAVSPIAVPLAAACGVKVAKLSGRGLGHTGGTLDKLECIPGLTTSLSIEAFKAQVAEVGCAIVSASEVQLLGQEDVRPAAPHADGCERSVDSSEYLEQEDCGRRSVSCHRRQSGPLRFHADGGRPRASLLTRSCTLAPGWVGRSRCS